MNTSDNPLSLPDYWDLVSVGYESIVNWIMRPFSLKAIELLSLPPKSVALDIACGSGTLCLPLSAKIHQVTALDFSNEMISQLKENLHKNDISNIKAIQGDGQNLPFQDESFDAAFSMFGLMFFPDRLQGFKEIVRVLKPGQRAVVSSWAPIEKSSLMIILSEALKVGYPEAPSPRRNSTSLETPEVFQSEMEEAGFVEIDIHEVTCEVKPLPPILFWETMSKGGPLAITKKNVGEKAWGNISIKATRYLTKKLGENGQVTHTTAYLGVGRKQS